LSVRRKRGCQGIQAEVCHGFPVRFRSSYLILPADTVSPRDEVTGEFVKCFLNKEAFLPSRSRPGQELKAGAQASSACKATGVPLAPAPALPPWAAWPPPALGDGPAPWPEELGPKRREPCSPSRPGSRAAAPGAAGLPTSTCPLPTSALFRTTCSICKWELTMEEIQQSEGFNIKYLYSKDLSSFVSHRVGK